MIALWRYLKKLSEELNHIKNKIIKNDYKSVNLYFQDESRFGLMTILRRMIKAKGVKPIAPYQHKFKNLYLFGAFSGINGAHFLLEMPCCNSDTFQVFLDLFAQSNPDEFKILILDNGAFHHAKTLVIPENIALLFLPAYCPELNPAENMWQYIKGKVSMGVHKTLLELQHTISNTIQIEINTSIVQSICGREFYTNNFRCAFNV
jgi:putative transposase